jgi:hypothetical protein
MKAYETSATVEREGQLRLAGVPFEPGTEVEVTVHAKRRSADEFAAQWNCITQVLRARAGQISDDEIQREIDEYRAKS